MSNEIPPQITAPKQNFEDPSNRHAIAGVGATEIGLGIGISLIAFLIYATLTAIEWLAKSNMHVWYSSHFIATGYILITGFAVGAALAYAIRPVKTGLTFSSTPGEQLTVLLAIVCAADLLFRYLRIGVHILNSNQGASLGDFLSRNSNNIYGVLSITNESLGAACFLIAAIIGRRAGWRLFCVANLLMAFYWCSYTLTNYFLRGGSQLGEFNRYLSMFDWGFYALNVLATLAAIILLVVAEKPEPGTPRPSLQRHYFGKALWLLYLPLGFASTLWFYVVNHFRWF